MTRNADTRHSNVFIRDRQTGTTQLASLASDGTTANGSSIRPAISANGRFVTFESYADNLVSGDSNGQGDIFVHDRETGETQTGFDSQRWLRRGMIALSTLRSVVMANLWLSSPEQPIW